MLPERSGTDIGGFEVPRKEHHDVSCRTMVVEAARPSVRRYGQEVSNNHRPLEPLEFLEE